ncbi:hypothetical protein [Halobacillus salinus]|uniref:Glycerophosphoryl diester phosphodiesterase membrane domain-containing protein n=1 Tax=Halobacillus salinus TaxID=192814 RepID=A0A4Z0GYD2_9BACI|nr:hypothetical protein [Halobacillus salinus]TGB02868.1 hypothetical protein E4663_12005 [Halobacillus salinus]
MDQIKTKPRSVGESLDQTFRLAKANFKSYFLILLFLMGPGFLINYIFLFMGGAGLLTGDKSTTLIASLNSDTQAAGVEQFVLDNLGSNMHLLFLVLTTLVSFVLIPMAHASVLVGTIRSMKQESWTVSEVIKLAFSRFWPLIGSTLLFGVIVFAFFFVTFIIIFFAGFSTFSGGNGLAAIIISIIFFLAFLVAAAFFAIKLSMFFAATTFEKLAPGFAKSWKLTKGRFWATFGFFAVILIINFLVSVLFEGVASLLLGTSVLSTVLMNLGTIVTTLFLMVGYAVIYADLRTRNEASDLKDMISDYKSDDSTVSTEQ